MYNPKFKENENFYSFIFSNGFEYEISKGQVTNTQDINEWIMHLKGKIWFNKNLEADFIGATAFSVKN